MNGDAFLEQFGPAAPYLRMSDEEKFKLMGETKAISGKKFVWVPKAETAYERGLLLKVEDGMAIIERLCDKKEIKMKEEEMLEEMINPPKMDKIEDMSDMTFLNEASVLFNLRDRYKVFMIYTYSGLFCVTVNPYKMLPVYGQKMIDCYRGKRKTEMPPHLYCVADTAYQNMLIDRHNQSMLITGESGAGKTVNTKKVIKSF